MNQELKSKWVQALRSGNYKQGKYRLRSGDGEFCCLGVLCDVVDNTKWEKLTYWYYDGHSELLPSDVQVKAEIDPIMSLIPALARMNDDDGKSFIEIAEYIDRFF